MPGPSLCQFAWLGTLEYLSARSLQDSLVDLIHDGESPNTLLLLEHPNVYTRGRLSQAEHLLSPQDELAASGISVYDTDRGGQVTYHGPGQLIGYPIINLRDWGGGPLQYVRTLEQAIVGTLTDFGIPAHTEQGLTGVWTTEGKVAAIGVKISRGVSFHGFSLNINTDLSWYRHIVPCGIADRPVTSMSRLLDENVDAEAVRYSLVYRFGRAMRMRMAEVAPGEIVVAEE